MGKPIFEVTQIARSVNDVPQVFFGHRKVLAACGCLRSVRPPMATPVMGNMLRAREVPLLAADPFVYHLVILRGGKPSPSIFSPRAA